MFKTSLAGALAGAALAAHAQGGPPPAIDWELQVVRDGQTIDTFHQKTTIGQSRTDTHQTEAALPAGCVADPAAKPSELSRTVTVAPLYVDGDAITLSLDTQDQLDDDASRSGVAACTAAPPRQIVASHPGLNVRAGDWTDWTVVDKHPLLVYRVRARVAQD
ncbi:hypothetical protein [Burkholderia alba]|uniref:hypothetical protein n=1 Tax=Burkholderia alba TaxID=2683677 RepID=UPI002B0573F6|nr:hypothetical protein [Burkholderia alba]